MLTPPLSSASGVFFGGGGGRGPEGVNVSEQALSSSQHCGKGALPIPWSLCKVIPNTWSQGIYRLDSMLKSFQIDQGHTQLTMLSVTALCRQVSDCISCLFQHQTPGMAATTSTEFQLFHFE